MRWLASRQRPTVRFYQGKERNEDIVGRNVGGSRQRVVFMRTEDLFRELEIIFYKLVERRIKKKIPVRLFGLDSSARREKERGPKELVNSKNFAAGIMNLW